MNFKVAARAGFCSLTIILVAAFSSQVCAQNNISDAPKISVGDKWKFERRDARNSATEGDFANEVLSVENGLITGSENAAKFIWTPDLNVVESSIFVITGEFKALSFPLSIGKQWDFKYSTVSKVTGRKGRWQYDAKVVSVEVIKVPAGEFETVKIEYKGFFNNDSGGGNGTLKMTNWYSPKAKTIVKTQFEDGFNNWVRQLTAYELKP
jgi:hypothetical protein